MKVYCNTCKDYTLLNHRKMCLWCQTKLTDANIKRGERDERERMA